MNFDLKSLIQAAVDTVRDPRAGARKVLDVGIPRRQRWEILILIVVLSALLAQLSLFMSGSSGGVIVGGPNLTTPFALGIAQLIVLLAMVFGIDAIGRRAGGTGGLDGAIVLVAWLQFVLICLQVLQILAFIAFPFLGSLLGLAGLVLFFWLLTHFVMELHGFQSPGQVFISILISLAAFAILMAVVLSVLGLNGSGP